jgi:hypothetical protein
LPTSTAVAITGDADVTTKAIVTVIQIQTNRPIGSYLDAYVCVECILRDDHASQSAAPEVSQGWDLENRAITFSQSGACTSTTPRHNMLSAQSSRPVLSHQNT